jgi:hypothetical protein
MNLIDRAKKIVLTPKSEWQVIAPEAASVGGLYRSYIIPLAAIGPVAQFIGGTLIGVSVPFIGNIRTPIIWGFSQMVLGYVLSLAAVYIIGLIIDGLAPSFGGTKNPLQAFKIAAFAFTPSWLAGILHILPLLGVLAILAGLYSLYVLYLGIPVLMQAPQDKALGYTAVVVICAIVVMVVFGTVVGVVGTMGMGAGRLASGFGGGGLASNSGSPVVSERINQMSAQIEAANQQMQAAQKSGDSQAQVAAAANVLAAVTSGGQQVDPVDQNLLKGMLPDTVAGLPRTSSEASKGGIGGLQVAKAEARYSDNQGSSVDLTITDLGSTKMLGAFAAWASLEEDKESDSGYEKMSKVDGRPVHEVYNKNGPQGDYETLVAGRFMVQANGSKVDMSTLKQAVAAIDLAKLDAMKDAGVKKTN